MNHVIPLGNYAACSAGGPAAIDQVRQTFPPAWQASLQASMATPPRMCPSSGGDRLQTPRTWHSASAATTR